MIFYILKPPEPLLLIAASIVYVQFKKGFERAGTTRVLERTRSYLADLVTG